MALSHRHRRTFNPQGFVQQTANFSLVDALLTYEEVIPDIIINGGEVADYKGVVDFLEAVKSGGSDKLDDSSLGGVVYNFLKLSQDVNELSMATTTDEEQDGAAARIDKLLARAKELQSTLSRTASLATDTKTARPASRFFSGVTVTSREMCLTELVSAVSAMVVHLNIFRMGGSPFEASCTGYGQRQSMRG